MEAMNQLAGAQRGRWAVGSMFFVNGFIIGSWAAQIPEYIKRLGVSEATFGLMILGVGLGGVIAMPCAGFVMARVGSRPVLLPLAAAAVFTLLVVVLAPGILLATIALFAMGAVLGGMDVAMNANAVTVERRLMRPVMSSTHGFWSLGGFFGGGVGGFAIQSFGYIAHAAFVGAVAAVVLVVAARHIVGGDRHSATAGHIRLALPRAATIYVVGLIAMICVIPEATMRNWAALFMEQELGANLGVAGLAFALFSGTMAMMRFFGDGIRKRFGAVTTLRASCLLTAAGLLAASLSPWPALAIAAFAVAGIGAANMIPIAFSAAGNHEGMAASTGMSVVMAMGSSGILIAPSAVGIIAEKTGIGPIFAGVAALLLCATLLASVVHRADFKAG